MLDYYQDIMPSGDWRWVLDEPLPTCFWANTLKLSPDRLAELLDESAVTYTRLPWYDLGFMTTDTVSLGRSWQYLSGLLQIQEAVSMLPGALMAASPGDRVLDLCAAPGNKTAQIAVSMNNQGTLVANDKSYERLRAMGQIQKRLGLLNMSVSVSDARYYPATPGFFDKVLADVPCSCEGTFRKGKRRYTPPNKAASIAMSKLQLPILRKAIAACKVGGRIVYSTCTFSPYENEVVVQRALEDMGGNVILRKVEMPHLEFSPGLQAYHGMTFDISMLNCMRIWPQQNNTGGFFVAVMEKCA